jgi:hypothetical protein
LAEERERTAYAIPAGFSGRTVLQLYRSNQTLDVTTESPFVFISRDIRSILHHPLCRNACDPSAASPRYPNPHLSRPTLSLSYVAAPKGREGEKKRRIFARRRRTKYYGQPRKIEGNERENKEGAEPFSCFVHPFLAFFLFSFLPFFLSLSLSLSLFFSNFFIEIYLSFYL